MGQTDATLRGRKILVVQQNFLVGSDLADKLRSAGAEVIGPAADGEALLEDLRRGAARPDVALVGVSYHGEPPRDLAEELKRLGVPFILGPGYFPEDGGIAQFRAEPDAPAGFGVLLSALARFSA